MKGIVDGHHGINEIWSNKYNKWFLSDAKYNHHFEKDGIPLRCYSSFLYRCWMCYWDESIVRAEFSLFVPE